MAQQPDQNRGTKRGREPDDEEEEEQPRGRPRWRSWERPDQYANAAGAGKRQRKDGGTPLGIATQRKDNIVPPTAPFGLLASSSPSPSRSRSATRLLITRLMNARPSFHFSTIAGTELPAAVNELLKRLDVRTVVSGYKLIPFEFQVEPILYT